MCDFESFRLPVPVSRIASVPGVAVLCALILSGCDQAPAPAEDIRPVRTLVAEVKEFGVVMEGVGEIRARLESDLGFRIGGKIVERPVNASDQVRRGALLARIDDEDQRNELRTAQALVGMIVRNSVTLIDQIEKN